MAFKMNRLAFFPIGFILAGSVLACHSPLSPGETHALDEAEARWAARPFQSYVVDIRVSCFCPPVVNRWSRVEVVDGSVTRVVTLESGIEVSPEERRYFRTVEQLFDHIREVAQADHIEDIVVEFDRELGYPTFIRFDPKDGILDAGSEHHLRNAVALP